MKVQKSSNLQNILKKTLACFTAFVLAVSLMPLPNTTSQALADEGAPALVVAENADENLQIQASGEQTMYRLYNVSSKEHLYTSDSNEIKVLTSQKNTAWKNEGAAWIAPTQSQTPVYRLHNYKSGEHHYTKDFNEVKTLCSTKGLTWKNEGIKWYSDDSGRVPIYRVFNAAAGLGAHHFTSDTNERSILTKQRGWKDEKIAWYGIANCVPSAPNVVYFTPSGEKYHKIRDCVSLKRSKVVNSGTVAQAGRRTPCNLCFH